MQLTRFVRWFLCQATCIQGCQSQNAKFSCLYTTGETQKRNMTWTQKLHPHSPHKDPTNQKCGFLSNNQVAADRRGGPRPRGRNKKANRDAADSSSRNQEHPSTGGASASAGSPASCAAALPDPVYVMVKPANQPGFNGQTHMTMWQQQVMWQEQVNNWQLISRDKQFESVDAEVFGPSGLLPHMDEAASAHTPRNQHHLPIGKGN